MGRRRHCDYDTWSTKVQRLVSLTIISRLEKINKIMLKNHACFLARFRTRTRSRRRFRTPRATARTLSPVRKPAQPFAIRGWAGAREGGGGAISGLRFFVPSSCGFFAILWRMFCGICAEKVFVCWGVVQRGSARTGRRTSSTPASPCERSPPLYWIQFNSLDKYLTSFSIII